MNKKFVFNVVLKGPRKTGRIKEFKTISVMIVIVSFYLGNGLIIKHFGKNIPKVNKPIINYPSDMEFLYELYKEDLIKLK
jgi:hypothetical protein